MKKVLALALIGVLMFGTVSFAAPVEKDPKVHDISDKVTVGFDEGEDTTEVIVTIPKVGSKLEVLKITKDKTGDKENKEINYVDNEGCLITEWGNENNDFFWGTIDFDEESEVYTVTLNFTNGNVEGIWVDVEFSAGKSHVTFKGHVEAGVPTED